MRKIILCLLLFTFLIYGFECVFAGNYWDVEWYKVSPDRYEVRKNGIEVHEFEEFLGSEKWQAGNFYYDWGKGIVYNEEYWDYIGFIATTKIYSEGGNYTFILYDVNDVAILSIDGEEIICTDDEASVNLNISAGSHTLQIRWEEHCCYASIGFYTSNESIFSKKKLPTVSIISPLQGEEVSGSTLIEGTAEGNIEKVEIKIDDGNWVMAEGTTSWSYHWDTTEENNGFHTIYARSYDGSNYSKTCSVSVKVNNSPTVKILYPSNGANVSGIENIHGIASEGVKKVEIRIDGKEWQIANGGVVWNFEWDTTKESNGIHVIEARSYNGKSYSNIFSLSVNVFNNQKPTVSIVHPSDGSSVKGVVIIAGKANDSEETLQKVEIKIGNGNWTIVNGTASWIYYWNTTKYEDGMYKIYVRAYDGILYSDIDSIKVRIVNKNKTPGFTLPSLVFSLILILLKKRN